MRFQFQRPAPSKDGSIPDKLIARVVLFPADLSDIVIGGIALWQDKKDANKVNVTLPDYGVIAGQPEPLFDSKGNVKAYEASDSGKAAIASLKADIASTWERESRRGDSGHVYKGRYDLTMAVRHSEVREQAAPVLTEEEMERATAPSAIQAETV